MNIFNFLKKDKIKKASWKDVTLAKFYKIQNILSVQDEYTENNLREAIYGIDTTNLYVSDLSKYSLDFLNKIPDHKNVKLKGTYILNGRKYKSNINLTEVKTNQFIDFTNYVKDDANKYEKLLSVFVVPEGHEYNDGYNMQEVWQDLLQMDIVTVQSLSFFMIRQLQAFAIIFQKYLMEEVKKMNITEEERKTMSSLLKQTMDLGSSLL